MVVERIAVDIMGWPFACQNEDGSSLGICVIRLCFGSSVLSLITSPGRDSEAYDVHQSGARHDAGSQRGSEL